MKSLFGVALFALTWMVCDCTLMQAQTQNHYLQQVQKATPTLILTSTKNPSNINDGTAATIQISGTGPMVPSGTVTFSATEAGFIGTLANGSVTVPIDSAGKASWVFNLSPGTYQLFASYSGDADYNPADATPISQQVIGPPDFTLTLDSGSLIVKQGSTWKGSLTATATNNFQGTITLSCDGGGSGMQCLSGQPVQMNASGVSHFPVELTTTATTVTTLSTSLVLFFSGFGLSKKKDRYKRIYLSALLSLLLLVAGCTAVRYQQTDGTPRGSYKLTFVGQSGSLSHAVTAVVVVQ
ncbi:MAG TPA: Ig-like domain-containing protein [Edaphobacter sp.]